MSLGIFVIWMLLHIVPTQRLDDGWGVALGLFGILVIFFASASAVRSLRRPDAMSHDQVTRIIAIGTLMIAVGVAVGGVILYLGAR